MSRLDRISEEEWRRRGLAARGSVESLAKSCDVTARQLQRFFREHWKVKPIQWLNELRLKEAPILLDQGKTAKEVAFALGYEDASHFTKEFKAFHGKLPSRFVEQAKPNRGIDAYFCGIH